jgi:hypothetical protein
VKSEQRAADICEGCGVEGGEADWSSQSWAQQVAVQDERGGRGGEGPGLLSRGYGQQVAVEDVG